MDSKKCKITLRDEINCNVSGLIPIHREKLINLWNIFVDGAYFMPAYKQGKWDGRVKFFHVNGNTYINILDDIVPWIIDHGYDIEVVDNRRVQPLIPKHIDKDIFKQYGVELRYYQVDAVNAAIDGNTGILRLGTGAGKTKINAAIIVSYDLPSITIVPNKDLVEQTTTEFKKLGIDVGMLYGTKKEIDHKHIVSTWQSLKNIKELLVDKKVVIVDECQDASAKIINELLTEGHGPNIPFRFGLTGTIPKEKSKRLTLKCSLGNVICDVSAGKLIKEGFLSNLHINVLQLQDKIDYIDPPKNTKNNTADKKSKQWERERKFLVGHKSRNMAIADIIKSQSDGVGNILVLVESVEQGELLSKLIGCRFISGDTDTEDRLFEYREFEKISGKVLIATYGIAKAGIDITNLHRLFLIDVKRAYTRVLQSIGRGLRKGGNKFFVEVFDICSNAKYSIDQMEERLSYYKEEGYPFEIIQVQI